jgi:hypothetical protein
MDVITRIVEARQGTGRIIAGIRRDGVQSAESVAASFGLHGGFGIYFEIDEWEATSIIALVMNKDMAYSTEILPVHEARELAEGFMRQFRGEKAKYYTNGTFGKPGLFSGNTWNPATAATFDTGVIVVAQKSVGCVWVMDED